MDIYINMRSALASCSSGVVHLRSDLSLGPGAHRQAKLAASENRHLPVSDSLVLGREARATTPRSLCGHWVLNFSLHGHTANSFYTSSAPLLKIFGIGSH